MRLNLSKHRTASKRRCPSGRSAAFGYIWLYLNLHIAEEHLAVEQLVEPPTPADLAHVAPPGRGVGGLGRSSTQVAEVTCSLGLETT